MAPAALAVVAYREHQKIVSTYGRRFLEHIHPTTRRIHTSFKALGAITGALVGGVGNDIIKGGDGTDNLWGGDGNDRLEGDDGNDVLSGSTGNDALNGGSGMRNTALSRHAPMGSSLAGPGITTRVARPERA